MKYYIISIICLLLAAVGWTTLLTDETRSHHFANGSEKYLNGYRLDLPEELSTVADNGDEGRKDTLIAYKDTVSKTIYIQFK